MSTIYELDTRNPASLTVIAIAPDGNHNDLNADGEPCTTPDDLRSFICELYRIGEGSDEGMSEAVRDSLLTDVNAIFGDDGAPPAHP